VRWYSRGQKCEIEGNGELVCNLVIGKEEIVKVIDRHRSSDRDFALSMDVGSAERDQNCRF
jgi:hypothetical protein